MNSLRVENLNKHYGQVPVLKDINIEIDSGEFLVLVGPSGCGKSTLLNMIAGLDTVTSGNIYIGDNVVNDLPPSERDIAMVFQSYALYPTMNVAQNMAFGMEMRGVDKKTRHEEVQKISDMLHINHLLDRKPAQLSGGQRQRVAMGRALVRNPKIFLFDEPLSNLDAKLRVEMRTEIRRLHQRIESTIVYVTHDQVEALSMATKIVVLNGGVVQQQGTPVEVYNHPNNTFVAGFMGSPPMNMISATIVGNSKKYEAVIAKADVHGKDIVVPVALRTKLKKSHEVIIGMRPEHLMHCASKSKSTSSKLSIEARLDLVELTGADTYGNITLGEDEVHMRLDSTKTHSAGDVLIVSCDLDKICWFDKETGSRLA